MLLLRCSRVADAQGRRPRRMSRVHSYKTYSFRIQGFRAFRVQGYYRVYRCSSNSSMVSWPFQLLGNLGTCLRALRSSGGPSVSTVLLGALTHKSDDSRGCRGGRYVESGSRSPPVRAPGRSEAVLKTLHKNRLMNDY